MMFYTKKYSPKHLGLAIALAMGVSSCTEIEQNLTNAQHSITAEAVSGTVLENAITNTIVAELGYTATDTENRPRFTLLNQSVDGALKVIGNQLMVSDSSAIDYENATEITGQVALTLADGATTTLDFSIAIENQIEAEGAFVTQWETLHNDESIMIYTRDQEFTYNYHIDWGDGTTDTDVTGDMRHTYADAGMHEVRITGIFPAIEQRNIDGYINANKLKTVEQWGENQWLTMLGSFSYCKDLVINDTEAPDFSKLTVIGRMFEQCTNFNSDISHWDVSNVTGMWSVFRDASSFNQDISTWDMSSVTDIGGMFAGASSFNQDLSAWDVSSVRAMYATFNNAISFDQDISAWDVSSVTNMLNLFNNARVFNQDLSAWNVGNVTNMQAMFANAKAFNQDLTTWDTSSVVNFKGMFQGASIFNGDITTWDTSSAINLANMFNAATSFNQDISGWDTSSVKNMTGVFQRNYVFNQPIGTWDTSSVTTMSSMLRNANSFNQDISAWDVSSVVNMSNMFRQNTAFNQDISNWDVSKVSNNNAMFNSSVLAVENRPIFL